MRLTGQIGCEYPARLTCDLPAKLMRICNVLCGTDTTELFTSSGMLPQTMVVDKNGIVIARINGVIASEDLVPLIDLYKEALAGKSGSVNNFVEKVNQAALFP